MDRKFLSGCLYTLKSKKTFKKPQKPKKPKKLFPKNLGFFPALVK